MKKRNLICLSTYNVVLCLLSLSTMAQDKETIFMFDGKVIPMSKIDSLAKAWGGPERISFTHSKEDDEKNIMHVVKITDEAMKKAAEAKRRRIETMKSMVNMPAPTWTVKDINGNSWSLQELKGKVVVINFWFTSCSPCIREMPLLNKLVAYYRDKEVVFIAFTHENDASVHSFLEKRPFDYVQVPNAAAIGDLYKVSSWPTSFVIDKKGKIKLATNYDENIGQMISDAVDAALE